MKFRFNQMNTRELTDEELEALDIWVANLMEPKPASVPLWEVAAAKDELYNCARAYSIEGWWKCATGSDAEKRVLGRATPCVWEPRFKIASDPDEMENKGSALLVLGKLTSVVDVHINPVNAHYPTPVIWGGGARVTSASLALSICLFAEQIFDPSARSRRPIATEDNHAPNPQPVTSNS